MDWQNIHVGQLRLCIPKTFRCLNSRETSVSSTIIKGRPALTGKGHYIMCSVQDDVPSSLATVHSAIPAIDRIRDGDSTTTYHLTGKSVIRSDGVEVYVTRFTPSPPAQVHSWTIVFPLNDKWVYFSTVTLLPRIERDFFENVCRRIIKSIERNLDC